jgi:hypothetical protein
MDSVPDFRFPELTITAKAVDFHNQIIQADGIDFAYMLVQRV